MPPPKWYHRPPASDAIDPNTLGDHLVDTNKLSRRHVDQLLSANLVSTEGLGQQIRRAQALPDEELTVAYETLLKSPRMTDADLPQVPVCTDTLSTRFLQSEKVIPLVEEAHIVRVAMAEPDNAYVLKAIKLATGKSAHAIVATPNQIDRALEKTVRIE